VLGKGEGVASGTAALREQNVFLHHDAKFPARRPGEQAAARAVFVAPQRPERADVVRLEAVTGFALAGHSFSPPQNFPQPTPRR
jgi:hypothetical protein